MAAAANMSYDGSAGANPMLQAFAAMGDDDKCSSFADEDREEEERAVADFVSGLELHNGKVQQRDNKTGTLNDQNNDEHGNEAHDNTAGVNGNTNGKGDEEDDEEDEVRSQQFSVDDVSDDEDVVADQQEETNITSNRQTTQEFTQLAAQAAPKLAQPVRRDSEHRNDKSGLDSYQHSQKARMTSSQGSSAHNVTNQQSTACDSTTNRDSQSSINNAPKTNSH